MNPWYFITIPIGMILMLFAVAFVFGIIKVARDMNVVKLKENMIEDYIDDHFHAVSVRNVWKHHDAGNGNIDGRLYIRTDGKGHDLDRIED